MVCPVFPPFGESPPDLDATHRLASEILGAVLDQIQDADAHTEILDKAAEIHEAIMAVLRKAER